MKKTLLASAVLMALTTGATAGDFNWSEGSKNKFNITAAGTKAEFTVASDKIVANVADDVVFIANKTADGQIVNTAKTGMSVDLKATDSITLNSTAKGCAAIWVQGQFDNAEDAATTVNVSAKNVTLTGTDYGVVAFSGANVTIAAEDTLVIKGGDDAIQTRGNSLTTLKGKTIQLEGDIDFSYDKLSSGTSPDASVLVLDMNGADSYWTGNVKFTWGKVDNSTEKPSYGADDIANGLTLKLSDQARWNVKNVEKKGNGTLAEAGVRRLAVNSLTLNDGVIALDNGAWAGVKNMSGNGTVYVQEDVTEGTELNVAAAKNASLVVTVEGMTTDNANAAATLVKLDGVVTGSAIGNGLSVSTKIAEGLVNGEMTLAADGKIVEKKNTVVQAVQDMASSTTLSLNRILMNDVRKRMGDLRNAKADSGVWARYDGGSLSGSNGLDSDFNTIQFGVDTVPTADAPRFGVAFSYTKGDTDYASGDADMEGFSLAGYATWMNDTGLFADVVARIATVDTDMNVVNGGKAYKASLDNVALSLSGELGWNYKVTDTVFVEPQAELTYTYVDSEKFELGTATYDMDAVNSLVARAGFVAGLNCPNNMGNAYVRASVVHEFLGDADMKANTRTYSVDGKDTWVEFGVGGQYNINDATYVWADLERTSGAAVDEDWRATVGVRYAF